LLIPDDQAPGDIEIQVNNGLMAPPVSALRRSNNTSGIAPAEIKLSDSTFMDSNLSDNLPLDATSFGFWYDAVAPIQRPNGPFPGVSFYFLDSFCEA
jgi:hypothetical protein